MYEPYIHAIRIGHPSTTLSHTLEGSASARPYCRDLERIRRADTPLANCASTAIIPMRAFQRRLRSAAVRPRSAQTGEATETVRRHRAARAENRGDGGVGAQGVGERWRQRPERPRSFARYLELVSDTAALSDARTLPDSAPRGPEHAPPWPLVPRLAFHPLARAAPRPRRRAPASAAPAATELPRTEYSRASCRRGTAQH